MTGHRARSTWRPTMAPAYILGWQPAVAKAVADLLGAEAEYAETLRMGPAKQTLAVARAILDGAR